MVRGAGGVHRQHLATVLAVRAQVIALHPNRRISNCGTRAGMMYMRYGQAYIVVQGAHLSSQMCLVCGTLKKKPVVMITTISKLWIH